MSKQFPFGHIKSVYGIDFSGAKNAGRKIWIAGGPIKRGKLEIEECFAAKDLPGSSSKRDEALFALVEYIKSRRETAFGLDFPFGLPASLVHEKSWSKFVSSFTGHYANELDFKTKCFEDSNEKELKRVTDIKSNTPWSPYNLRLFRQTYFGVRCVLLPLVCEGKVSVIPMVRLENGKPILMEICPACTLRAMGYSSAYKGKSKEHWRERRRIAELLSDSKQASISDNHVLQTVVENVSGDALDSVLAAFATHRAATGQFDERVWSNSVYQLEGFVFV